MGVPWPRGSGAIGWDQAPRVAMSSVLPKTWARRYIPLLPEADGGVAMAPDTLDRHNDELHPVTPLFRKFKFRHSLFFRYSPRSMAALT